MKHRTVTVLAGLATILLGAGPAVSQITAPARPIPPGITIDSIKVHGASLEGNLEGNSADRNVLVILPQATPGRRTGAIPSSISSTAS